MCKNQLHAELHSAEPLNPTVARFNKRIEFLEQQIKAIEKELKQVILNDEFVWEKIKKIITIPGISFVTAATIIAETSGFLNIKSIRQLNYTLWKNDQVYIDNYELKRVA